MRAAKIKKCLRPNRGEGISVRGTTLFARRPLRLLLDTSVGFVVNGSTYPLYASPFPPCLPWSQPKSKPGMFTWPQCTLYAGERLRLIYSPKRLRGEFTIRAYRFTPPTGSLESPKRLLLLITAFNLFDDLRKIIPQMSSCFIF